MKNKLVICIVLFQLFFINYCFTQNIQLSGSQGSGIETGGKMTQDANGNIYCFGIFTDTMRLGNTLFAVSNGNFDCYIAKFNRYMQPQWIKTIGSVGAEGAGGISYFDGKLFLGGWYGAQTIIHNDTLIYNFDCVSPGFIASIDTSGNFIRAKAFTKASNSISCFVNDIKVNQTGVAIAGRIKGQFDFGNNQTINTILNGTQHDGFIARFDTAFSCNFVLPASSSIGLQYGDDGATSVQIDTLGNTYVGGYFGSLSSINNATLYFGGQTLIANGGMGFSDYFIAKLRPNGAVAWLSGSGGNLPDLITNICLENNSRLAMAGRYSGNSNVGGIPLPPSPNDYSSFIGSVDSAGTGLSAFRVSNESTFQSLKKGADGYLYAADINTTSPSPWPRFKIYKVQSDSGVLSTDSILFLQTSNNIGDILPPTVNCSDIIINCSFNELVNYQNDTLIQNSYTQNLYDFFYGKYSMNGALLSTPQINLPNTTIFCSNNSDISLTTNSMANVSDYHWQLIPSNAGSIADNGNTAILNIDSTYSGQVKIVCYASNFCNISPLSDTLVLSINQAPIIYSINDSGLGAVESNIINASNFNWYLDNLLLNFNNMSTINCIGDGVYSIIATNANCSDTLASFVSCIISQLNEITAPEINIYPNPAKENITIETDLNESIQTISICDVTGKIIKQTLSNANKVTLNIKDLSKGCYFIDIQTGSSQYRSKLLID